MSYSKMDRFGDAPYTDNSSFGGGSFVENRRARVTARARANSTASDVDSMLDQSFVSVSAMASPAWSTASFRQQQQQPSMDLFSPVYPALLSLNEDTSAQGGGGEVSIAESLRSPGAFGSPSDWSPQQQQQLQHRQSRSHQLQAVQQHLQQMLHMQQQQANEPESYSFEFPSMLPPTSFPVVGATPQPPTRGTILTRARHASLPDAYQQQTRPQSLMQMHMINDGGYGTMIANRGGQVMEGPPGFASRRAHWGALQQQHQFVMATIPPYARAQWMAEQPEPPARRARPVSMSSRRNSCSDTSVGSSRGSSRGSVDCSYCRSVNKDPVGHNKHNCPILRDLPPCRACGASGKDNHTESHCPYQEKTVLQFIPKIRRRRNHSA